MVDPGRPLWQFIVSLALPVLVIVLAIPAVVRGVRDQRSERNRAMRRDTRRTRSVTRDLRQGRDIAAGDLPLAQAVVDGTRASVPLTAMMLALSATSAFSGATTRGGLPWLMYFASGATFLAAVLGVVTTRSIRRGGARVGLRPGGRKA